MSYHKDPGMNEARRILILEDNADDVALLLRELKKQKISFTADAVSSRHAYEQALHWFRPDLILSDYSMPGFDGLSAFHIKQDIMPDVPFIIISGAIGEENAIELIKAGVTDYALKDKLFTLGFKISRALRESEEVRKKKEEGERLLQQHRRLMEIAFLQSHQVRRPVATILGLINLFNANGPGNPQNAEIVEKLVIASKELDSVIKDIVQKTNQIKDES
jgi:CheY-like chemotaxis protein